MQQPMNFAILKNLHITSSSLKVHVFGYKAHCNHLGNRPLIALTLFPCKLDTFGRSAYTPAPSNCQWPCVSNWIHNHFLPSQLMFLLFTYLLLHTWIATTGNKAVAILVARVRLCFMHTHKFDWMNKCNSRLYTLISDDSNFSSL